MIGFLKFLLIATVIGLTIWRTLRFEVRGDDFRFVGLRKRPFGIGLVLIVVLMILFPAIGSVDAGYRGVVLRFGAVTGRVLPEGIYIVTPFMESVEQLSVQVEAETRPAEAASKDLQRVATEVTLNYRYNPLSVHLIYQQLRRDAIPRIIAPAIQESVKAATAHYNAEQLITERAQVKDEIESLLSTRLGEHHIDVDAVNITDFDFTDVFNESIESKVRATQEALRAENELERVKMEAAQKIEQAKAEAESLRLQREQITDSMLQLRLIEAQREAIAKWDGRMPAQLWSSGGRASPVPVIDVFKGANR